MEPTALYIPGKCDTVESHSQALPGATDGDWAWSLGICCDREDGPHSAGTWWGTGHETRKRHQPPGAQSGPECQMKPFILEGLGYVICQLLLGSWVGLEVCSLLLDEVYGPGASSQPPH